MSPPSSPPANSLESMSGVLVGMSTTSRSSSPNATGSGHGRSQSTGMAEGSITGRARMLSQSSTSGYGSGLKTDLDVNDFNTHPIAVDPVLALELRIRWIEALVLGVKSELGGGGDPSTSTTTTLSSLRGDSDVGGTGTSGRSGLRTSGIGSGSVRLANRSRVGLGGVAGTAGGSDTLGRASGRGLGKERELKNAMELLKPGEVLVRLVDDLRKQLDNIVAANDGFKKFMDQYDQYAHFLTPSFALSGILPDPPSYENLSPEEVETLLVEMEPDIRAADRDMREIEALETKGVTGAGKLADYEQLQPRLETLLSGHQDNVKRADALEQKISSIMERHATHIDALSELFVIWDEALTDVEDRITRLEREKTERIRLGLE
ncbi:hypothetical protein BDN72DRAFT_956310 [Pluteus cervinus]|uniref:Uncharacterized protein n=1 Tax=Pluteus cervinus TaxID=181527 RepID=A0ACD3B6J4_9AGAR|nr:hypothetical protein BDN72DRAFT_956310 [Pluteus cervinus]